MALTKVSRGLLTTSIVDNGNATAITIDSNENVGIGVSPLTLSGNAAPGLTVSSNGPFILLQDANNADKVTYISNNTGDLQFGIVGDDGATGKTEHMRIDGATGSVGIGTSSITNPYSQTPFTDLNIDGTWGGVISFKMGGVTKGWVGQRSSGNEDMVIGATAGQELLFYENNVEAMRISSGFVGIGTSSPSVPLTVAASSSGNNVRLTGRSADGYAFLQYRNNADSVTNAEIGVSDAKHMQFYTNSTERMRIDSAGNFLLGTTSAISLGKTSVLFDGTNQNGFIAKTTRSANGSAFAGFVNSSGTVIGSISQDSSSTVNYISSSDQRLKENITDSDDSGNVIDAIQVRKFNWIADGAHEKYGFIAQELKAVVPNAVSSIGMPDEEDPMLGVDPSKLMALAIKEIQMLRARVAKLENT